MANKKLSYDQIADKNLLNPLVKEIEQVNSLLKVTSDLLKGLISESTKVAKSTPLDGYKNINKVSSAIDEVTESTKKLDKIEKERLKLTERLQSLRSEEAKDVAKLRAEVNATAKALRDEAKATLESNNAYKVLTKRTNDAQAEFKKLAAQFGVNSKEAKAARKEFNRLDDELRTVNEAARDGRRDVGRYAEGFKSLNSTVSKLGAVGLLLKALEVAQSAFSKNTEGANNLQKGLNRLIVPITVLINNLVELGGSAGSIFNNFLVNAKININELNLSFLKGVNTFGNFDDKIKGLTEENEKLAKSLVDIKNPFDNFTEDIEQQIKSLDTVIDLTSEYITENAKLEKQIAQLTVEQSKAQAQADDTTKSFESQLKGIEDLAAVNEKIDAKRLQILKNEQQLAKVAAEGNKANVEAQAEFVKAQAAVLLLEAEQQAQREMLAKQRTEVLRDQFEQELDILFDVSDRSKSINERIAADESKSLADRRAAIDQARQDIAASYKGIQDSFNEFIGDNPINLNELLSIEDTTEFQNRVDELRKQFNIDEITINRLREARIELDAATQDLTEANRDLTVSEREYNDIQSDVILQEETLNAILEDRKNIDEILNELTKKRTQNEIENLQLRLSLTDKKSKEFISIQQELNEKLIEQEQDNAEKQKNIDDKAAQNRVETQEKTFAVLSSLNDKYNEKQLDNIDKEIDANQRKQERLLSLAEDGSENALENLAETEKKQAQLERERERQIQRQKREELALAIIQTYSAKVAAGEPNALVSSITDTSLLQAFVSSLPTFFEGAENVGEALGKPQLKGKDGHLVRVDGNERVLNNMHNAMIPKSMSNGELARLASKKQSGTSSDEVVKRLDKLNSTIDSKPVYLGRDYNATEKAVIDVIAQKGRIERNHKKVGGIW